MAMSRSRGGTFVTSRPPMMIAPPDVSSSPAMQLSSVDLPQPDGPTSTRKSPALHVDVDVLQHLDRAEPLLEASDLQHRRVRCGLPR